MILLGTALPERSKPDPKDYYMRALAGMSGLITAAVRPQDAPVPPWRGANKAAPLIAAILPWICTYQLRLLLGYAEESSCQTLGHDTSAVSQTAKSRRIDCEGKCHRFQRHNAQGCVESLPLGCNCGSGVQTHNRDSIRSQAVTLGRRYPAYRCPRPC